MSGSSINFTNCTVFANTVQGGLGAPPSGPAGAGFGDNLAGGPLALINTIVAGAPTANFFGPITDLGHNLSSDASAALNSPGSVTNTNPLLGPLGNYGGSTLTLRLLSGAPHWMPPTTLPHHPPTNEAAPRPYNGVSDIGAFESSPPYTVAGRLIGFTPSDTATITIEGCRQIS